MLIDYTIKVVLTIPFLWLVFLKLRHLSIYGKMALHIFLCPLYIFIWIYLYHEVCDWFGIFYLKGIAMVWDIYIPFLLYITQFSILHIHEYYQIYRKQLVRENELQKAQIQSELSALRAQINPHFLYNVLNTISAGLSPQQEESRELIANLADLFRLQLQVSQKEQITLEEELSFVQKYLDLEKARFKDKIHISFEVDITTLQIPISPLLIQPLVENAIKHGIAPILNNGVITIKTFLKDNFLNIEVLDTGIGFVEASIENSNGVGIKNTKLRLEKLYGTLLEFEHLLPQGTKVYFKIPIENIEHGK
jgi:LytS/YehU family sensor histidine kinase